MSLEPNTRIGPYEILAPLGAGGMGEVYRARDTKLDRDVALKVLSAKLSGDADSLARFEREAKAVAALSHPNILAIHDFGVEGGVAYAVTELLEGETLRARLGGSSLPVRKAIDHALQLAAGLAAAHEKGIVHRDLKPENLFLTNDGRLKILDFGLARIVAPDDPSTQSPTAGPGTMPGAVMGTVGYMSPEQVKGRPADHRSDLFAFGTILYEMLTGARAFRGDSAAETMSAILKEDPPELSTTGRAMPPGIERIVQHCLEKAPEQRFQSARDIAFALEALSGISTSGIRAPGEAIDSPRKRRGLVPAAVVVVTVLAVAAAYVAGKRSAGAEAETPREVAFHQLTYRPQTIFQAASTAEGKTIVYSAALKGNVPEIFAMDPEFPEPRSLGLPGTHLLSVSSKGEMALLTHPKWINHRLFQGTLARMPIGGGAPRELMENVRQADWAPDGEELAIIHEVEGKDRLEYPPGKVLHEASGYLSDLRFSPSGDRIAFFQHPYRYDDRGSVQMVDLSGNAKLLSDGYWGLEGLGWTPDGRDILFSGGTGYSNFAIYRVSREGVTTPALQSAGGLTFHTVLPGGRWLVTRDDQQRAMLGRAPGETEERDLSWMELSSPIALSEDGTILLFSEQGTGAGVNYLVCTRKTDGSPVVRLGEGNAFDLSPDAKWVVAVVFTNPMTIRLYPTGPGEPKNLERGNLAEYADAQFFPDGQRVLVEASEPGHASRCYEQELSGGAPRAITPEGTSGCRISPEGKRIVAQSPGGAWNVYPLDGGEPVPVPSILPGENVSRFGADGRSIIVYSRSTMPAPVTRVDLSDGHRTLIREIAPPELSGAISMVSYVTNATGSAYVYAYYKYQTQLYLVDGVH